MDFHVPSSISIIAFFYANDLPMDASSLDGRGRTIATIDDWRIGIWLYELVVMPILGLGHRCDLANQSIDGRRVRW
ncbi:unnamed protein product [Linum trigynum]|uniref:Uncharacterized protein n=1 Tax=Linum trigynum TaxID=586398 RepID=A0AAV2F400_9ROSI